MASYKLIEHTADIGIEATAGEREGLARQCGLGLSFLLYGSCSVNAALHRAISANGNTPGETLVNWLNELLFAMTDGKLIPADIRIIHFTENEISAEISADHAGPDKYPNLREIKAVTHHQTSIDHEDVFWHARVYLDL